MFGLGFQDPGLVPDTFSGFKCGYSVPYVFNNLPENFELTPEEINSLRVFQTDSDPLEKLKDIAWDLSHNVTKIYGRDDFILAFDLVAHSSTALQKKGWVEGLVISSPNCGKTKCFRALCTHYGLPDFYDFKGRPYKKDIIGDQFLTRIPFREKKCGLMVWRQRWGLLAQNDRRMLVIDGYFRKNKIVNHLSPLRQPRAKEGKLSMRVVSLQSTLARTRLLWSAAVEGVEKHSGPCARIVDRIVPNPDDLYLFDFVLLAMSSLPEVNASHNACATVPSVMLYVDFFRGRRAHKATEPGQLSQMSACDGARVACSPGIRVPYP